MVCDAVDVMVRAAVLYGLARHLDAVRHLEGHLEIGRERTVHSFVDAAGQRLHLHDAAHVHRGGMHKV